MRTMLILLGIGSLLIVAVLIVGAALPRRHVVSRSASFRSSPEQLFSFIAGSQDWRPDVSHSELLIGPGGQKQLRETDRHGRTILYDILDSRTPQSITRRIATRNLPYSGSWTYSLTPSNDGATLRITEDGEVPNPIFRFVSRFLIGQTSTIDTYLHSLGKATNQDIAIQQ